MGPLLCLEGEVGHPVGEVLGAGLTSEVQQERGQVAQVCQVCRTVSRLTEDGDFMPGEGVVDAGLGRDDGVAGSGGGDGGEVVLALLDRAGPERVPADSRGANSSEARVALVAEGPLANRAGGGAESGAGCRR